MSWPRMGGTATDLEVRQRLWHALQADPEGYDANLNFGLYCAKYRLYQHLAEPHLLKALAFKHHDEHAQNLLFALFVVYQAGGHFDQARETCQALTELQPGNLLYPYFLGDIEMSLGNLAEASAIYTRTNDILSVRAKRLAGERGEPIRRILISASPTHRHIGELARMLDLFVKARGLGLCEDFEPLLLAPEAETANPCLLDYWREHVTVVSDEDEVRRLYDLHAGREFRMDYITFPAPVGPIGESGRATFDKDMSYALVCKRWEDEGRPPVLSLTPEHQERGRRRLAGAGLPKDAWFVCLHVRDQEYYGEDSPFSVNRHRSSDIMHYIPAIAAIVRRGGWVIRVGGPTAPALPAMEGLIDYAHSEMRSDWMDIFCFAAARFFLGTPSGPQGTAAVFGVPVVTADWFPLGNWPRSGRDIFIHRLLAEKDGGEVLSLAETLRPPLFNSNSPALIDRMGLDVIANSEIEIQEATEEMLDRLDGSRRYCAEDDRLQEIYKRLADPYNVGIPPRLARRFLERHPELLGEGVSS